MVKHTQIIDVLVFDHFLGMALKWLKTLEQRPLMSQRALVQIQQ